MADAKPARLAKLIKGKTLYCVDNFCATVNWLTSCWSSVKAQYGVKISGTNSGVPVIEADLEAGPGVTIEDVSGSPTKISANLTAGKNITLTDQDDGSIKIDADGGGSLTLESGTTSVSDVSKVVLKSGDDSDVKFTISSSTDSDGNVTATVAVDVYYK